MGSLTQTRCFNHGQREAVARCPSCRRHYCRECVTEHEHRLLCASCIQAISDSAVPGPRRRLPVAPVFQLCGGVLLLWLAFFGMGQALLLIPSEFHDQQSSFFEEIEAEAQAGESGP